MHGKIIGPDFDGIKAICVEVGDLTQALHDVDGVETTAVYFFQTRNGGEYFIGRLHNDGNGRMVDLPHRKIHPNRYHLQFPERLSGTECYTLQAAGKTQILFHLHYLGYKLIGAGRILLEE